MKKNRTYFVALGGVIAALSVVIMFMTGLFPYATFALPALAGVLLIAVVIEAGPGWAFLIFAAVSLLSILFSPDKEAAAFYILFFGHYPILKRYLEGIPKRWVQWIAKFALFEICMTVSFYAVVLLSGFPKQFNSLPYLLGTLLLLNITFLLYDFALSRLVVLYVNRIRKMFKF